MLTNRPGELANSPFGVSRDVGQESQGHHPEKKRPAGSLWMTSLEATQWSLPRPSDHQYMDQFNRWFSHETDCIASFPHQFIRRPTPGLAGTTGVSGARRRCLNGQGLRAGAEADPAAWAKGSAAPTVAAAAAAAAAEVAAAAAADAADAAMLAAMWIRDVRSDARTSGIGRTAF